MDPVPSPPTPPKTSPSHIPCADSSDGFTSDIDTAGPSRNARSKKRHRRRVERQSPSSDSSFSPAVKPTQTHTDIASSPVLSTDKQREKKVTIGAAQSLPVPEVAVDPSPPSIVSAVDDVFPIAKLTGKATFRKAEAPLILAKSSFPAVPSEPLPPVPKRPKVRGQKHEIPQGGDTDPILQKDEEHVVCVACISNSFNMEGLTTAIRSAYYDATCVECTSDETERVLRAMIPVACIRPGSKYIYDIVVFFFDYGVVAYWGPNERTYWTRILQTVAPFAIKPEVKFDIERCSWENTTVKEYPMTTSASETEQAVLDLLVQIRQCRLDNDHFYLYTMDPDVKLAFTFAMAQSAKLSYYEDKIDHQIEETKQYPVELAEKGEVRLAEREIARIKGKLFVLRMNIILHTDLLDTPDYFWERTELEPLYVHARRYFEISRRVRVLNERLGVVAELFDMLHQQQKQKHSDRLEWIVIWLIAIEIVVAAVSIYLKLVHAKPTIHV